jgi:hypothetical protein
LCQKFQSAHPVIRWGGAILVGLIALELIAQEAISVYAHLMTVRAEIAAKNSQPGAVPVNTLQLMEGPDYHKCRRQDSRARGGSGYWMRDIPQGVDPDQEPQGRWPCP